MNEEEEHENEKKNKYGTGIGGILVLIAFIWLINGTIELLTVSKWNEHTSSIQSLAVILSVFSISFAVNPFDSRMIYLFLDAMN